MSFIFFVTTVILGFVLFQKLKIIQEKERLLKLSDTYIDILKSDLSASEKRVILLKNEILGLNHQITSLKNRVLELEKYQDIIDVEKFVEERKNRCEQFVINTKKECESLIINVKEYIEKVNIYLEEYEAEALSKIEVNAKNKLEKYYEQVLEKEKLSSILKALENKISGYSDEYLLPTQCLLDDLIDGYEHLDATRRLKAIREQVRSAIKENLVADCDYIEDSRRVTAIAFVADAFNSKADVHISRLKHDNVGKLIQALRDDYILINNNGSAFRNARINEHFLDLRLQELKWASLVLDFKEKEREEQRQIREQMREEEKARREYEKAIREAEKEEYALTKAYEKAKLEYEKATDDQKSKFDNEIQDLLIRLKQAEEKNIRALSMAQQTKAGHVYVISNIGSFGNDVLKLGMTRRLDPMDRVKELGDASVPFIFDVHAMIYSDDAPKLENALHKYFNHQRVNKVNYKKEFFKVELAEVKKFLDSQNIQAKFTMKAEALQYRESIQIDLLPDDQQRLLEDNIEKVENSKHEYAYIDDADD